LTRCAISGEGDRIDCAVFEKEGPEVLFGGVETQITNKDSHFLSILPYLRRTVSGALQHFLFG
jgi:hypothetical protein